MSWLLHWQADAPPILVPDAPLIVTLDGSGAVIVTYTSAGDETITLTANALTADPALDPVLEVVSPSGERLAYNDDFFPARMSGDDLNELALQPTDSAITALTLTEAGDYRIRVTSFNGVSTGEVEVRVQRVDPVSIQRQSADETVTTAVTLRPNQVAALDITLEAGREYTLTARDPLGVLDPVMQLLDASGAVLAENDDHGDGELTLNIFDSRIESFTASESRDYVLSIRDYLGRGGVLRLEVRAVE